MMEHARKMILVPEENAKRFQQLLNLPPTVQTRGTALTRLDREMSEISNSNSFRDDREKWASYQNVLEQYLRKKNPEKPVEKDEGIEKTEEEKEKNLRVEAILQGVSKTFRSRAKQILEFVDKTSNIRYTDKGKLVIDDVELPDSNITMLVNCAASNRKSKAPNGMAQFSSALQRAGVPKEFIGNKSFFSDEALNDSATNLNSSRSASNSPQSDTSIKKWEKLGK